MASQNAALTDTGVPHSQIVLWTAVFTAPDNTFRSYVSRETTNLGKAQPGSPFHLVEVPESPLSRRLALDAARALLFLASTLVATKEGDLNRFKFSLSLLRRGPISHTVSPARIRLVEHAPRQPSVTAI